MEQTEQAKQSSRELKMMTDPIAKIIPAMAAPTIVSFLINSIYSLADTFFVSSLGTNATAAVSVNASLDQIVMMGAPCWRWEPTATSPGCSAPGRRRRPVMCFLPPSLWRWLSGL